MVTERLDLQTKIVEEADGSEHVVVLGKRESELELKPLIITNLRGAYRFFYESLQFLLTHDPTLEEFEFGEVGNDEAPGP